ncbi:MAG: BrnT family toxin [Myxococcales bacterium]|nr:BrnT family toxin [Myxococcales bacterium]
MDAEWDPRKAVANRKKHGVDFADAVTALSDDASVTITDDTPDEEHFVTIGTDALGRIVVVIHTWRAERVRLLSARHAMEQEIARYAGKAP